MQTCRVLGDCPYIKIADNESHVFLELCSTYCKGYKPIEQKNKILVFVTDDKCREITIRDDLYVSYDRLNLVFRDIVDGAELGTTWTEMYNMVKNDKRND
jgi:hypothetical protein